MRAARSVGDGETSTASSGLGRAWPARPIGHFPVFRRSRWPPHGLGRGRCYSRACLEACLTVAHLSCELRQLKAGARSDGRQVKDVRVILCFVVEKEKQLSLSTFLWCPELRSIFGASSCRSTPRPLRLPRRRVRCLGGKHDAETRAQHGPRHGRRYFPVATCARAR